MRVAGFVAFFVFAGSAAVQWNDPDPWRWGVLYGSAALLALGTGMGMPLRRPAWICGAVYGALALWWLPTLFAARTEAFTSFRMRAAGDEAPREAIGLLLCLGWALAVARLGEREKSDPDKAS